MTIIHLVRHPEATKHTTAMLKAKGAPLTAEGEKQARLLTLRFAKVPLRRVFSSPYHRTLKPAQDLADAADTEVTILDELGEFQRPSSFGDEELERKDPRRKAWMRTLTTPGERFEDGECYDTSLLIADMLLSSWKDLGGESIAMLHGWKGLTFWLRALFGEKMAPWMLEICHAQAKMAYTGITTIQFKPNKKGISNWNVLSQNDTSHLR